MLELNPHDNQGVRFLLHDIDEGLSWEKSMAREEEERERQTQAFRHAQSGGRGTDVIH